MLWHLESVLNLLRLCYSYSFEYKINFDIIRLGTKTRIVQNDRTYDYPMSHDLYDLNKQNGPVSINGQHVSLEEMIITVIDEKLSKGRIITTDSFRMYVKDCYFYWHAPSFSSVHINYSRIWI